MKTCNILWNVSVNQRLSLHVFWYWTECIYITVLEQAEKRNEPILGGKEAALVLNLQNFKTFFSLLSKILQAEQDDTPQVSPAAQSI